MVAAIRPPKCIQILGALPLVDDGRWVAEAHEEQIQKQPAGASIPIEKRMDPLEAGVELGGGLRQRFGALVGRAQFACAPDPVIDQGRHVSPFRRGHPPREGLNVVSAKGAWRLVRSGIRVWRHVPDRRERQLVDVPDLRKGQKLATCPLRGLDCLPVDPIRRLRVPLDLRVLPQFLVADSTPFGQELLDLPENERVPLDCGRVVRLFEPDTPPDAAGFMRRR